MVLQRMVGFFMLGLSAASTLAGAGEPLQFNSGNQQVQLIELYTSQGCSSCPPAEKWFNQLKEDKALWESVIPLNFHVDYWDYLGWEDPFANVQHTVRQHKYRQQGNVRSVYTPGFVLNGKEWKGWFSRDPLPQSNLSSANLSVSLQGKELKANYSGKGDNLVLNVAILGFEIKTSVKAGENEGHKLAHEFVVLAHQKHRSIDGGWQIELPAVDTSQASKYGLALWVSPSNKQRPLQATGGWLPKEYLIN